MSKVRIVWTTPDAEKQVLLYCARVSSADQENPDPKLLKFLINENHWSPFEMANACIEVETTRDIARQILRHRSFSFQEFSQRYAVVSDDPVPPTFREARSQDKRKRQCSHPISDVNIIEEWKVLQQEAHEYARKGYKRALELGIAKEQARALLPEGLTPTKLYVQGTLRSWIHYIKLRSANGTQPEHAEIARAIQKLLAPLLPNIAKVLWETEGKQET